MPLPHKLRELQMTAQRLNKLPRRFCSAASTLSVLLPTVQKLARLLIHLHALGIQMQSFRFVGQAQKLSAGRCQIMRMLDSGGQLCDLAAVGEEERFSIIDLSHHAVAQELQTRWKPEPRSRMGTQCAAAPVIPQWGHLVGNASPRHRSSRSKATFLRLRGS